MKKVDYNQFTKSDLPLDTSFQSPASGYNSFTKLQKPKITAIGKSAKDKLKKQQQTTKPKSYVTNKSSDAKTRIEKLNDDELEMLNGDGLKAVSYRSRRNKTIIIVLIILLMLTLVGFGVFFAVSDLGANCFVYLHGDVDANVYIDDQQLTMFRTPTNIKGNRIFEFDTDLKINSYGMYKISYYVAVYSSGKRLQNTQIIKSNSNFSYNPLTFRYESQEEVVGGERINLFEAITLDWEYEKSLNVDNFKMELNIYITKA